jgi:hypothetical protein
MYFLYVDESGDSGAYDSSKPERSGTRYFILCGWFFHAQKWKIVLETMKAFRKKIAREGFLPNDVEFHCAEMISPHTAKAFTSISIPDRWKLIKEFSDTIGSMSSTKMICVVIDKEKSKLHPNDYLKESVTQLYKAFDEFLKKEQENGLVFFDRASEKTVNTHVRKLLGTGSNGISVVNERIGWVIEDPIFKISGDSLFIQASDTIAYTLKEKLFPISARRKMNADKIFDNKLVRIIYKSMKSNSDGIIYL